MADVGEATQNLAPALESKAIAFIDCCGYSRYTSVFGDRAAVDMHFRMRRIVDREAAATQVDVVKWMGDGVMLVSDSALPVLTCIYCTMLAARKAELLPLRAGMACGSVATVTGGTTDYLGSCVNRAARLCAAAAPWQLRAARSAGQAVVHYTLRPVAARREEITYQARESRAERGAASDCPSLARRPVSAPPAARSSEASSSFGAQPCPLTPSYPQIHSGPSRPGDNCQDDAPADGAGGRFLVERS